MRVLSHSALAAALLLPALACATGPSSGTGGRDLNVITLEEIEATDAETASQLIQQLRPRWLMRNRGERTFEEGGEANPLVLVDEFPPREIEFLHQIRKATILEIRYLDPREATFKYGTGYSAGAFVITTRR